MPLPFSFCYHQHLNMLLMKERLSLIGFLLFSFCLAKAQEFVRNQEFQLSVDLPNGIRTLGIYYKLGFKSNPQKYWRARIIASGEDSYAYSTDLVHNKSKTLFGLGFEKRIPPSKNSQLVGGVEIFGMRESISAYNPDTLGFAVPKAQIVAVGIGFPVGVIFNKNAKWYVGLEATPSIQFQKTLKDEFKLSPNPGKSWGFYNHSFAICFGYRIPTKRLKAT